MRLIDGEWACALCGEALKVPADQRPRPVLMGASGEPRMRALYLDGVEIHRCPFRLPGVGLPSNENDS